jgi:hypothetical protein|tara:strand:- start:180 stop:731 length:552 start_codon:yes stop_codon:yes gene_type:complete
MPGSDFRNLMLQSESSRDYGNLNNISGGRQVAGGYQFRKKRIKDYSKATGEKFTNEEFLKDAEMQERVMDWHEQDIINYAMNNGLDQFIGQEINGVPVDMSAIVGMGHLGGRLGMRQFLQSGGEDDPADDYGTRISDYGKKFAGQSLYRETPMRPQMRPEGLLPPAAPATSMYPQMRPKGLLN